MDAKRGENAEEPDLADRPSGLIGAVDNVLRMLRLFEDHEMIRVNQVARDMNLSRSTVHRMLTTLSHHRFVEQDEFSRAYKPGPALVDIGLAVLDNIDIRGLAHSALTELRDRTNETAHLALLRGTEVVYLDSVESKHIVRTGGRVGRTLPAHGTAAGKALLAELSDDALVALYPSGELASATPRTATTLDELRRQLTEVRRVGYAFNDAESEDDVRAVAAVVRDKRGRPRAALATTAPLSRSGASWAAETGSATVAVARELGSRFG
ncbi:IclR family transcriptional regulator [Streptomyces sp. ML-6]|uniref:IclR family transcriptional regulator n=1 Tax=Streptomyces sp. ML-6 TaxID=2982693 RepID=UPI0024C047CA|nr:IclR family transcriptional regulator [Streptomyces sp. ML-6]MDK0524213.1 IclR family transcriptional regulator [Streptomyces sp. ML-6]